MIQSRFRLWALLPLLVSFLLLALSIFEGSLILGKKPHDNILPGVFLFLLLVFSLAWLVLGELRRKVVKVCIETEQIKINNYFGLGSTKLISFKELDGFKISFLRSDTGLYEFLYLMKGKKKAIKLSEFYHRNYKDLKSVISSKLTDLGVEKFSYIDEYKEIFK